MGFIRILLAISVVSTHYPTHKIFHFVGGEAAVQIFFFVSGFYTSLILPKYSKATRFLISRYLRVYPLYLFFAVLSLLYSKKDLLTQFWELPLMAKLFLCITNVSLFAQDVTMFLGIRENQLTFVSNFQESNPPLFFFLLIPQAWSLGTELWFYLLSPLLNKFRSKTLILLFVSSVSFRFIYIVSAEYRDPWNYRFLPFEIAQFILGILVYRFYQRKRGGFSRSFSLGLWILVSFSIIIFPWINLNIELKKAVLFLFIAISIGPIFEISKKINIDRFLAMISYPVYVSHIFVTSIIFPRFGLNGSTSLSNSAVNIFLIILMALLSFAVISYPLEKYRRKIA